MINRYLLLIFLLLFTIYSAVGISIDRAGGDALDYLVISNSLLKDHDIDLANNAHHFKVHNLDEPGDWIRAYNNSPQHPVTFLPTFFAVNTFQVGTRLLPTHGTGLSFIIMPFLLFNTLWGPRLLISLAGAFVCVNIFLLASRYLEKKVAFVLSMLLALSSPLSFFGNIVFTEMVVAAIVTYSYRVFTDQSRESIPIVGYLLISLLPWFHIRYLLISLAFGVYILYQGLTTRDLTRFSIFSSLFLVSTGSAMSFLINQYQTPSIITNLGFLGFGNPITGFIGLTIDREAGLCTYAPIYLVALPGAVKMLQSRSRYLVFGLIYLTTTIYFAYHGWSGGFAPPARFLVPYVPLLVVPISIFLNNRQHVTRSVVLLLGLMGVAFSAIGWFMTPFTGFEDSDGKSYIFHELPYGDLIERLFPAVEKGPRIDFSDRDHFSD